MPSPIRLAANGIPLLYDLLDRGDAPIDYIKCPLSPNSRDEVARALRYRPVLLHGWGPPDYRVLDATVPEPDLLAELAARVRPPFLSVHLDARGGAAYPGGEAAAIERLRSSVRDLRALSGLDVVLENVLHYPWVPRPRFVTDPRFWHDALAATGAAMLLDLAHARVAAFHLGRDVRRYLSGFPLARVRELHLCGPRLDERGLEDRHMSLRDEDTTLLDWILPQLPRLEIVTLEVFGRRQYRRADGVLSPPEPATPEALLEQLERLREAVTTRT